MKITELLDLPKSRLKTLIEYTKTNEIIEAVQIDISDDKMLVVESISEEDVLEFLDSAIDEQSSEWSVLFWVGISHSAEFIKTQVLINSKLEILSAKEYGAVISIDNLVDSYV